MTDENPLPNRSTFTLVRLPGAEKLAEDASKIRVREGPTLSKSMLAFSKLTADLAQQPEPERIINYRYMIIPIYLQNIPDEYPSILCVSNLKILSIYWNHWNRKVVVGSQIIR